MHTNRLYSKVLYNISPFSSALVSFFLATVGICGQIYNVPTLKSIIANYPSMSISTAIGIILISIGIILISKNPLSEKFQKESIVLFTFFIAILAIINFSASIFNYFNYSSIPSAIDSLSNKKILFASSIYTASCQLLLSFSIIFQNQTNIERYIRYGQALALLALIILLIVSLGYLFSISILFRTKTGIGMAIHTWSSLLILSIGVLNLNKKTGFPAFYYGTGMGSEMIRGVLPPFILVIIVLAFSGAQFANTILSETNIYALLIVPTIIGAIQILLHLAVRINSLEEELIVEQTRYHELFEGNPDAIIVTDDHGQIIEVNLQATQLTGYNRKDLIDKPVDQLIVLPSSVQVNENSLAFLKASEPHENNLYLSLQSADDQVHPVNILVRSAYIRDRMVNILSIRDQTEKKQMEDKIEQLDFETYHDPLTSLPNRRMILTQLKQILNQAKRNQSKVAIGFCDLDGFKKINDSLGHEIGDALLIEIGQRITKSLRGEDVVARLGGDEFIIVLNQINDKLGTVTVFNKIIKAIAHPYQFKNTTCQITTSIGISLYPDHGHDHEDLISKADFAMYLSKNNGKNQFHFFEDC